MTPNHETNQGSVPSSRDSLAGAGWRCQRPGSYKDLIPAQLQCPDVPKDLIIDRSDLDAARFLVLGDTGEGDESQFALVPPLLGSGKDTHFMVICSDVVYPNGDVNE